MTYPLRIEDFEDLHEYYLYMDHKPDGSVFYVGIGTHVRVFYRPRNKIHSRICHKYHGCFRKVIHGGTRPEMMEKERELVSTYGRLDNGTGTLSNMTDGGEGASNYVFTDEARKRLQLSLKRTYSDQKLRNDISIRTKEMFKDPTIKQKHLDGVMKAWSNESNRANHKLATKLAMARPDVKKRQSSGIQKAFSTEEAKKKRSEISKRILNDPSVNAKLRQSLKIAMNKPETRAKMKIISNFYQSDPVVVAKKSRGTRDVHMMKTLFVRETGYSGRYSKISLQMIFDYVDQAQVDALNNKAADQTALRKAVSDYRKNKSKTT